MTDRAENAFNAACTSLDEADPSDVAAACRALVYAMLSVSARLIDVGNSVAGVDDAVSRLG